MSKYDPLWEYLKQKDEEDVLLSYDEIAEISGVPLDHSFLNYKKELTAYGYEVVKISMKAKTVRFHRTVQK